MTLEQLRIFVAVANRQHVTRAAEALSLTQSAVSAAVAALERQYDVALFDRVGRGIELTQAGRLLLTEARSILDRVAEAEALLADLNGLRRGHLRIKASQTIVSYWLPERLVRFRHDYPGVTVEVAMGNTQAVRQAILVGEADLGFIEGEIEAPELSIEAVAVDALLVVAAPSHPLASTGPVTLDDLLDTPWVVREPGSGVRSAFEAAMVGRGVDPRALRIAYELPSNEAVRAAVEMGAGIAALSRHVTEVSIAAGRLAAVNFELLPRQFCMVRHGARTGTRAVEAFMQSIRGLFAAKSDKGLTDTDAMG